MISIKILLTLVISRMILATKNPVKIRTILVGLRIILFTIMTIYSGNTWFPLIFHLLFSGGILMIFIILSSIIPNEKTKKIKIKLLTTIILIIRYFNLRKRNIKISRFQEIKIFLNNRININFIITLIIIYFITFLFILRKENLPIRTIKCYKKKLIL